MGRLTTLALDRSSLLPHTPVALSCGRAAPSGTLPWTGQPSGHLYMGLCVHSHPPGDHPAGSLGHAMPVSWTQLWASGVPGTPQRTPGEQLSPRCLQAQRWGGQSTPWPFGEAPGTQPSSGTKQEEECDVPESQGQTGGSCPPPSSPLSLLLWVLLARRGVMAAPTWILGMVPGLFLNSSTGQSQTRLPKLTLNLAPAGQGLVLWVTLWAVPAGPELRTAGHLYLGGDGTRWALLLSVCVPAPGQHLATRPKEKAARTSLYKVLSLSRTGQAALLAWAGADGSRTQFAETRP